MKRKSHSFRRVLIALFAATLCGSTGIAQDDEPQPSPLYDEAAEQLEAGRNEAALATLGKAVAADPAHADKVLHDPAFQPLIQDASSRTAVSKLLREHAAESIIVMVTPDEPGEPLIVTGHVVNEQGEPIKGALVYLYHTDSRGIYSSEGDSNPRLFGYLRTDEDGRFEYRTVRPASYPDTNVDQHVHYRVRAEGYENRTWRLGFEDDPHWEDREPDRRWVKPVTEGEDGIDRCEDRIVLERAGGE